MPAGEANTAADDGKHPEIVIGIETRLLEPSGREAVRGRRCGTLWYAADDGNHAGSFGLAWQDFVGGVWRQQEVGRA